MKNIMKTLLLISVMQVFADKPVKKPLDNNPVVMKINKKEVRLKELAQIIATLTGGVNLATLSPEQLNEILKQAKQVYALQEILMKDAILKGYDKNPKYKPQIQKAINDAMIGIYLSEIQNEASDAELQKAYKEFLANFNVQDYKVSVVVVKDEAAADNVMTSVRNNIAFSSIAKQKSLHSSAESATPGSLPYTRVDYLAREFGQEFVIALSKASVGKVIKQRMPNGTFVVAKLEGKKKAAPISFNEIKPRLAMQVVMTKVSAKLAAMTKSGEIKFYGLDGKVEEFKQPGAQKTSEKK